MEVACHACRYPVAVAESLAVILDHFWARGDLMEGQGNLDGAGVGFCDVRGANGTYVGSGRFVELL